MDENKVNRCLDENVKKMKTLLPIGKSFDVIQRDLVIGGRKSSFYFIDGFTKDEVMLKIMDSFFGVTVDDMPEIPEEFVAQYLPYVEVDVIDTYDAVVKQTLSGVTCLFIDGYEGCIAIDCRTYPVRGVEEPEKDKSLRGSRDGFVETIVFNTALLRRRIRDEHLIMEMCEVGKSSRTDVVLAYLSDRIDPVLLEHVRKRIANLDVDALRMNQQSLAENIYRRKWFNPFPKFKFSERPDTTAACLLEGKLAILVDNSPSVLILPTSIYDMIEEANDHYFPPLTNIYLKVSRALITFLTVFLVPVFYLLIQNPEWIPRGLQFIRMKDPVHIPVIVQILILELSIDGLRLAALNTPSMLSTPLSVIAGIVMGEFSVKSGWFSPEIMLYMAFVSVANYTQPNFELGYALKFMRLSILILTALWNWVGFLLGTMLVIGSICMNKTLSGKSYLNVRLNS